MNAELTGTDVDKEKVGDYSYLFDICVIGSLNIDLTVYPKTGETVLGSSFLLGFGGKGSNQAAAAASLGGKVSFVGKVGTDDFGNRFKKHIRTIGVNVDIRFRHPSGLTASQRENILTIVNPAPTLDPNQNEQRELFSLIPSILALSDFCCPNETEAMVLAQHHLASWNHSVAEELPPSAYTPVLYWLAEKGVRFPIVTLGPLGLVALIDRATCKVEFADVQLLEERRVNGSQKSVFHIRAPRITKVVDTTGAGDCFVGALAYFVACHSQLGLVEQLRRAVWVASQSVKAAGTQRSYPAKTTLPPDLFSIDTPFPG